MTISSAFWRPLWVGFLAFGALLISPSAARPADMFLTATTPLRIVGAAIDSESGAVAIIDGSGRLTLYPQLGGSGTLEGAIKEPVGGVFDTIVHKHLKNGKGYFVAASGASRTLHILDDRTLAEIKVLPVDAGAHMGGRGAPVALAASNGEQDPYVVASGATVHRFNLATLAEEGRILIQDPFLSAPNEIAMSADGSLLYGRLTQSSPTGVRCWQITTSTAATQPTDLTAVIRHSEHNTRPMYVTDRLGQFVACGKTLFTADMAKIVAELPAMVRCFHPTRPFAFGYEDDALVAISLNSLQQVASVAIKGESWQPGDNHNFDRRQFRPGKPPTVAPLILVDSKHHNLLLCFDKMLVLAPESALALPEEPFLFATLEGSAALAVGRPAQLRLVKQDQRAQIELVSGPAGMTLAGATLHWTPKATDVGVANVKIKLSAGTAQRVQDVQLNVRQLFGSLPFSPDDVRISADGSTLLALKHMESNNENRFYPGQRGATPYCRVAIVGLTGAGAANASGVPTLIADRTLSVNVSNNHVATLDDHFVYLPLQDSDAFLVLSLKDLSDVRRIFTSGRVGAMASAGGKLYLASNGVNNFGQNTQHCFAFSIPALDPVALPVEAPVNQFFPNGAPSVVPVEMEGGWLYNDILYDLSLTRPRLNAAARNFLTSATIHGNTDARPGSYDPNRRPFHSAAWDVVLQGMQLQRVGGQAIGQIDAPNQFGQQGMGVQAIILDDIPVVAILDDSFQQSGNGVSGNGNREVAKVEFRDLQTAASVGTVTLLDEPAPMQRSNEPRSTHLLATRGALIAVVRDRIFSLPVASAGVVPDATKLPVPLHFVHQQTAFVIAADRPTVLRHELRGGEAPVNFTLATETPGIKLDPSTGTVTLDGVSLAPGLVNDAFQALSNRRQMIPATQSNAYQQHMGMEEALAAYRKEISPRFAVLAGRAPVGVPMAFTIGLIARDKNQQVAMFDEVIVMELSANALLFKAKAADEEEKKLVANNVISTRPAQAGYAHRGPATRPFNGDDIVEQRISDLERENAALRAKVEVLSDLLRDRQGVPRYPTTRPN